MSNLKTRYPEIFSEWFYTLNVVSPNTIKRLSRKKFYWKCKNKKCGHIWKATIYSRIWKGNSCPKCEERRKRKFPEDLKEIRRMFKEIEKVQEKIDQYFVVFFKEDISKTRRFRHATLIRKGIKKIENLNFQFRKIVLEYKKKMVVYNKENNIKEKEKIRKEKNKPKRKAPKTKKNE